MKRNSSKLHRLARIFSVLTFVLSMQFDLLAQTVLVQQAALTGHNTEVGDGFGVEVDIAGDTLVVAAPYEPSNATGVNGNGNDNSAPNAGAAYVFVRNGTNWTQQAYIKASNTGADDWFGYSLAISGDTIVVGAYHEASNGTGVNGNQADNSAPDAGAAYVFVRNGTNWTQQAYLKASNSRAGVRFGDSVGISGDTIVVGARTESTRGGSAGAAYVFVRNGTNWTEQAILYASNAQANDQFGDEVAISGDSIVVSSSYESSSATGVNGNQNDNSAQFAGAAYIFVRNGTTWTQQAYLKASNTGLQDYFGDSVAISGDTVVVGARAEDSSATGVNGNQSDNSLFNAGAAYIFTRNGTTWSQQAYLKASTNPPSGGEFGTAVDVSGDIVAVGAFSSGYYVFARDGTNWTQQAHLNESNGSLDGVAISGDTVVVRGVYVYTGLAPLQPQIAIEQSAQGVRVSWPLTATGYALEQTTALSGAPDATLWSPVLLPLETNATHLSITVPTPSGTTFYRLRKP